MLFCVSGRLFNLSYTVSACANIATFPCVPFLSDVTILHVAMPMHFKPTMMVFEQPPRTGP